jgi:hypothetical protein
MDLNPFEIDIYYINLNEHKDRDVDFNNRMINSGFSKSRINRIEGIRKSGIPQDSVFVGCFHSQLKTLKTAVKKGSPFIILEDDATINRIPEKISVPNNSDVVYIGISSWGFVPQPDGNLAGIDRIIYDRVDNDVVRIFNMLSSHAILYINMDYVKRLIDELEKNLNGEQIISISNRVNLKYYGQNMLPCDVIMANMQYKSNAFALRDPVFYQDDKHKYCTLINI